MLIKQEIKQRPVMREEIKEQCWVCLRDNTKLIQCPKNWADESIISNKNWEMAPKFISIYHPGKVTSFLCENCIYKN
tara:strand:- start:48 stop:278 length:231 start_codon:yes stop_codon:yes gene_type:complete